MPAASSKRVKGYHLERKFIIGNIAHVLPHPDHPPDPKRPEEHTKGWTVYVRPLKNGPDIRTWLKKVQFKLHHTYANASRIVEASSLDVEDLKNGKGFEVKETGYGEFAVEIRLYFAPEAGEKATYREHYLVLGPHGTEEQKAKQEKDNLIVAERLEIITFPDPTVEFYNLMTDEEENFGWLKVKKGRGKGKKPEYVFEGDVEPTAELPEKPPAGSEGEVSKGGAWSRQFENQTVAGLKEAQRQLDDMIAAEQMRLEQETTLPTLRGPMPPAPPQEPRVLRSTMPTATVAGPSKTPVPRAKKQTRKPQKKKKQSGAAERPSGRTWTPQDDAILVDMRDPDPDKLTSYKGIGVALRRTELACRLRAKELRKKGKWPYNDGQEKQRDEDDLEEADDENHTSKGHL